MAHKSYAAALSHMAKVIREVDVTDSQICQAYVSSYKPPELQLSAEELVRVSKILQIRKKQVQVEECKDAYHIKFTAKSIVWCGVLFKEEYAKFRDVVEVTPIKSLISEPLMLEHKPSRLGMLASELQGIE